MTTSLLVDNKPYSIYTDNETIVVAWSTYAGKTVKGIAKCDPRDVFDLEKGISIATARCNYKIAKKKRARAYKKYTNAREDFDNATNSLFDAQEYFQDSEYGLDEAHDKLILALTY